MGDDGGGSSPVAGSGNAGGEVLHTTGGAGGTTGTSGGEGATAAGQAGGGQAGGGQAGSASGHAGTTSGQGGTGGDGAPGCDPSVAASNKAIVNLALDTLFVSKDLSAIDKYWADPYLQHNPIGMSGVAAFRSLMSGIVESPSFTYERLRTLAECDLVVVQGRYSATGIIFDMFRVQNGKLMEHWDSDAQRASPATGSTELKDLEKTQENRELVLAYLAAPSSDYLSPTYVDHRAPNDTITLAQVHHVVANGNFVFTLSEGQLGASPHAFYDLFRVADGKLVERWDSKRVVPDSTASGLPIF